MVLRILFLPLLLLFLLPLKAQNDWADSLNASRKERAASFLDPSASPLSKKELRKFKGTDFFPTDSSYRINAELFKHRTPKNHPLVCDDDRKQNYLETGYITFELQNNIHKLYVFQNPEIIKNPGSENYLFLPFADSTNGTSTFAGGRYLKLNMTGENTLLVDFNYTLQPLCAVSERYSCPLPPEENFLPFAVNAGEKYKKEIKGNGKKKKK